MTSIPTCFFAIPGNVRDGKQFRATSSLNVSYSCTTRGEWKMDKDRVEGAAKNVKGKIKEGVGKMTGDTKTETEGQADQVKGKAQNVVGGMKDKAREILNGD